MELEKLLNKLIEKGWRPFGFIVQNIRKWPYDSRYYFFENCAGWKSLRELVSKESWLWQFVCQNDLYPPYIQHRWFRDRPENWLQIHDYRYWLIESALRGELELERFLLDNIKI